MDRTQVHALPGMKMLWVPPLAAWPQHPPAGPGVTAALAWYRSWRGELRAGGWDSFEERAWDAGGSGNGGKGAQFGLSIVLGVFIQSACILYQRKSRELKVSDPWLASC